MPFEVANGTMPARGFDWDSVGYPPRPVREFARLHYGKALREPDRRPGSVPVFGTNGPCGWHDEPLAEGPGVILGRKGQGHLGVKWCREPFWVIDTAYFAEINQDEVDLRWFYYITEYVGLDHLKTGEKPGLNRDVFGRQVFPFPPLNDQREIVRILGMLDDKIELNRQMNSTLEGMARALFKSWFVDFDPVTAKAAGRYPFGMSGDLAALFPDRFDDSPIGPIPAGWTVSTIGEAVRVVGGSTPSTKEPQYWQGGTIQWCTPRDLSRLVDPVVLDTERKITEAGLARISSGLLPKGTVLLSSRAPIGYLAIAEVPLAVNQGFIAMICDRQLPNQYVLHWAEESMDEILSRAGGTTFAEISKRSFRPIPALIPARPVLDAFVAQTHEWHEQIAENLRESTVIAQTRDALLPQLLSGEIRLRHAEKLVEEVA